MTISFIAVRDNLRADGWLVVGDKIYPARSGRNIRDVPPDRIGHSKSNPKVATDGKHKYIDFEGERGDVPPGTYEIGKPTGLSADNQLTMTPGDRSSPQFKKFSIIPVGNSRFLDRGTVTGVRDDRYGAPRTSLLFHYDGDVIGSAGCIVYDDLIVQKALEAAYNSGDKSVRVIHVGSAAEARAQAERTLAEKLRAAAGSGATAH